MMIWIHHIWFENLRVSWLSDTWTCFLSSKKIFRHELSVVSWLSDTWNPTQQEKPGHGRPWAHGWLAQPPSGGAHRHPPGRNPGWTPPEMVPGLDPGVFVLGKLAKSPEIWDLKGPKPSKTIQASGRFVRLNPIQWNGWYAHGIPWVRGMQPHPISRFDPKSRPWCLQPVSEAQLGAIHSFQSNAIRVVFFQ